MILADRLVITKTDIAGEGAADALRRAIARAQSGRRHLEAVNGELDPSRLTEPASRPAQRLRGREPRIRDGIGSFVLTDDTPMPGRRSRKAMDTLMALRGPDLLRVKGFLDVEGCKGPVVVQFVQHLAHPPVELDALAG